MFTGLIESMGRVRSLRAAGGGREIEIEASFTGELSEGESVSVDGVCLTVERQTPSTFTATAVAETLRRSRAGDYRPGVGVNLERAVRLADRLGGHLVTGHIDCTGRVESLRKSKADWIMAVAYPTEYAPLLVDKGSVAIDGVSLTVVEAGRQRFTVAIVPQTRRLTTLGQARAGTKVNLEFDLVAKYLRRFSEIDRFAGDASAQWQEEYGGGR